MESTTSNVFSSTVDGLRNAMNTMHDNEENKNSEEVNFMSLDKIKELIRKHDTKSSNIDELSSILAKEINYNLAKSIIMDMIKDDQLNSIDTTTDQPGLVILFFA